MRYGYRPAFGDLLFKERDNAAAAAQNITKPYGDKAGFAGSVHALHKHFGYPFRAAHYAGRIKLLYQ